MGLLFFVFILLTGNNGKYKVEGQVLTIYNVETTDAGNYTCSAFMGTKHLVSVQKKMIQFIVQCMYSPMKNRFNDMWKLRKKMYINTTIILSVRSL